MKKIILRTYSLSKKTMQKYDLYCQKRYVYYDYVNNYISSAGIPAEHTTANEIIKANKHRFTKKKYPLF